METELSETCFIILLPTCPASFPACLPYLPIFLPCLAYLSVGQSVSSVQYFIFTYLGGQNRCEGMGGKASTV
jgi:hypothetical protein